MDIYYRTKDGLADYKFSFEDIGDGYRAYIVDMPSYGSRDQGLHTTHRLRDNRNRYYVCWSKPLYTLDDLKKVVALWSDYTQIYIKTGRTIDQQVARQDVLPAGIFHGGANKKPGSR